MGTDRRLAGTFSCWSVYIVPGTIPDIGVKGAGTKQQGDLVKTTKEALCQGYWRLADRG